jgi:hypothetical protein
MSTETESSAILDALYPQAQRYIFVFQAMAFKRTNIQAVEFLYLLQIHTRISEAAPYKHLQIVSTADIT